MSTELDEEALNTVLLLSYLAIERYVRADWPAEVLVCCGGVYLEGEIEVAYFEILIDSRTDYYDLVCFGFWTDGWPS